MEEINAFKLLLDITQKLVLLENYFGKEEQSEICKEVCTSCQLENLVEKNKQ